MTIFLQGGNEYGRAFRDVELEKVVLKAAQESGIGAQSAANILHMMYESYACPDTELLVR